MEYTLFFENVLIITFRDNIGGGLTFVLYVIIIIIITHAQLCLTLCDSIDYSLPGSSVHGIFPARILE